MLVVIDGSKALAAAVKKVFRYPAVQRCRLHYPDWRVMPSRGDQPLWDRGIVVRDSA
jgi:transposase-like protein